RMQEALSDVVMNADSLSGERLHEAVDLLQALAGPTRHLSPEELATLRERYRKLCEKLDDQVFIRDLESVLKQHDRLVRHTALALWDKGQIESQLARIEDLFERAPEIPYGRSELLRSLQGKRLVAPAKGCYFGVLPHEEMFLSPDRLSVTVLEESTGGVVAVDSADMIVQGPDGNLINIDQPNHPARGLPFSPPLSLWMKTRMLEGRVPVIMFRLVDEDVKECYSGSSAGIPEGKALSVQDVLEGKLDDYFKGNLKLIAEAKGAVLIGFLNDFDREPAATAFGADGRTPYYDLVDAKLAKLPPDKRNAEIKKRLEKGVLTKDTGPELRRHYGDPAIPDGPERVKDCWIRLRKLVQDSEAANISLFCATGSFHGNKKALALPGCYQAGCQDWNKLEHYWPGEGVVDWIGTQAVGLPQPGSPQSPELPGTIEQFALECRSSRWNSAPVLLRGMAPAPEKMPAREAAWVASSFTDLLPRAYPDVHAFFLDYPQRVTLWSTDGRGAFRRYVSGNPYYKQKLNLR
ncbi:MAG TPA: hypothetical protein V6D08_06985, partial [Candidatus Obscuribacterales bacterium]